MSFDYIIVILFFLFFGGVLIATIVEDRKNIKKIFGNPIVYFLLIAVVASFLHLIGVRSENLYLLGIVTFVIILVFIVKEQGK